MHQLQETGGSVISDEPANGVFECLEEDVVSLMTVQPFAPRINGSVITWLGAVDLAGP